MHLKKCWITQDSRTSVSLSLESAHPIEEHSRIQTREMVFPDKPSDEHPLRHTIVLSTFDNDDLHEIAETIYHYLAFRG
jgi:hypothetical protein